MELFSHLSALGCNYMCKSTEIIKCAIMGELQKYECKSLTKVFRDFCKMFILISCVHISHNGRN